MHFKSSLKITYTYINGTSSFAFIILSLLALSKSFYLNLNDSESVILSFGPSLQNWYKLPVVFE